MMRTMKRGAILLVPLAAVAILYRTVERSMHPMLETAEFRGSIEEPPVGAHVASHAGASCFAQTLDGRLPQLPPASVTGGELMCFPGYVSWFSPTSRTPVFSAERLTRDRITAAKRHTRFESFHDDAEMAPPRGPRLSDYVDHARDPEKPRPDQDFDRGHLSPDGDSESDLNSYDTFSLAGNIVAQNHRNNIGIWDRIEGVTRYQALKYDEEYVVTGPLFEGRTLRRLKDRVLVPTSLYKAVYIPAIPAAGVYVSPNDATETYDIETVDAFRARTGIDPFPTLTGSVRGSIDGVKPPRGR